MNHTSRSQVKTPRGMISSARRDVLHFSMKNAGECIGKQRENPSPPAIIREQRANTIKKLQIYSCQLSVIVGKRQLTVILVSPPILPSSSKQKSKKPTTVVLMDSNIIKMEPIHGTDSDMVHMSCDRYLISIGSNGCEITLWNKYGVELTRWQGHSDHITGFSWEPYNFKSDASTILDVKNRKFSFNTPQFVTFYQTIGLWDVSGKLYCRFDTRSNLNDKYIQKTILKIKSYYMIQ